MALLLAPKNPVTTGHSSRATKMDFVFNAHIRFATLFYKAYADNAQESNSGEGCPGCLQRLEHVKTCTTAGCRYFGPLATHGVSNISVIDIGGRMYELTEEAVQKELPTQGAFVFRMFDDPNSPENQRLMRFALGGYYIHPAQLGEETYEKLVNYLTQYNLIIKGQYCMKTREYKGIVSVQDGGLYLQKVPYLHECRIAPDRVKRDVKRADQKLFNGVMNNIKEATANYDEEHEMDGSQLARMRVADNIQRAQLKAVAEAQKTKKSERSQTQRKQLVKQRSTARKNQPVTKGGRKR